jgi:hypothetical protein
MPAILFIDCVVPDPLRNIAISLCGITIKDMVAFPGMTEAGLSQHKRRVETGRRLDFVTIRFAHWRRPGLAGLLDEGHIKIGPKSASARSDRPSMAGMHFA